LGYIIGEGELNIDPTNMEAIIKLPTLTNIAKARSFIGETWYLEKFIVSFSSYDTIFYAIIAGMKSF